MAGASFRRRLAVARYRHFLEDRLHWSVIREDVEFAANLFEHLSTQTSPRAEIEYAQYLHRILNTLLELSRHHAERSGQLHTGGTGVSRSRSASTEALEVSGSGDDVEEYSDHEVAAFVKKFFTDAELHIFMPFVEEPRTPSDKHFRKFEEGVDSLRHLLSQKFKGDEELAQFALEMLFMYYFQYDSCK